MLVTLVAALVIALPPAVQVDDPAKLVPASTLIYFGTHSVRAGADAAANSAMRLILDEPEVKGFLEKPVTAADKVLKQMLTDGGIEAERAQRLSIAKLMSGNGAGAPIGKVFAALTHVGLPSKEAEAQLPDIGLVVGVELLDAEDLGLVKALWSRIDLPEEVGSYSGHEYFQKTSPKGMSVSLTFVGNLAVASLSMKSLEAVMDRASATNADNLAASAEYAKLLGTAGGLQAGGSSWLVRMSSLADVARAAVTVAMSDPSEAENMAKVGAVLDGLGLAGLKWMGGVDHRDVNGRVHGTSCVEVDTEVKGLLPRLMGMGKPVDAALSTRVPADCIGMSAGSLDWLPAVYDFAMSTLEAVEPDGFAQVQGMLTQVMGESDLRADILANVHGNYLSYAMPGEGITGTPTSIFRFGVTDADRFVAALGTMASSISMMVTGKDTVKLNESDHEGHRFFEIDVSSTGLAGAMMQPAFAVDGEQLVFSLESPKAVKSALNYSGDGGSLADNAAFEAFVKQLTTKGSLTSVSFTDNARTFAAAYTQAAGLTQMLAMGVGDLPVDLALMPGEASITKHLAQSYTGGYVTDNGRMQVRLSEGQFQLCDFLPIAMTGAVLGVAAASGQAAYADAPVEADPYETVQKHLAELSAGMTVYKISEGQFPAAISDLVKPLEDYPQGCLGKAELPIDPWGQAYNFRLNAKGRPFLWSSGPDGVDQGGEGDDIAKT